MSSSLTKPKQEMTPEELKQREEEEIRVCARVSTLARAVHVGIAVGAEALSPIVKAAGQGGIHQLEAGCSILRRTLLVQVDGYAGHVRRPTGVDKKRGIIEGTRRGINHLAVDSAGLANREGLLAEFNETVLAREALPTLSGNPGWIDSAGGTTRPAAVGKG